MLIRHVSGASFVALGLGALGGCNEPVEPPEADAGALFRPDSRTDDSLGDGAWRQYLRASALHQAWAPDPSSPWRPYYRPTLPAAVSIVASAARPVHREDRLAVEQVMELRRRLILDNSALFIDLPGEDSVAWGNRLSLEGILPVATFNNWPHARGILKLERPLGAMIYYAAEIDRRRKDKAPFVSGRPAFLLEGTRLQSQRMSLGPDEFDNRYFHVPSDFPPARYLTDRGIQTVIYVRLKSMSSACEDDLVDYFVDLGRAGLKFQQVTVDGANVTVVPWIPSSRTTIFTPDLTQTYVSTSRGYGRSYGHYHGFWRSHQSTWGERSSGGGGGSRTYS